MCCVMAINAEVSFSDHVSLDVSRRFAILFRASKIFNFVLRKTETKM